MTGVGSSGMDDDIRVRLVNCIYAGNRVSDVQRLEGYARYIMREWLSADCSDGCVIGQYGH